MQNAELDEGQTGIKTAGRNISSPRYADDITLMKENENEEKLKSFLNMKEESEKSGLKLNVIKMQIIASGLIATWQIEMGTMETV